MNLSPAEINTAAPSQPVASSDSVQQVSSSTAKPNLFQTINPLEYAGWDSLLSTHNENAFFHSSAWARVLHASYGHQPFYFCRISDSQLHALLPVMEVSSWCTGRRGVSLPFTDECPGLKSLPGDSELYSTALALGRSRAWR